jgi:hypothetical protein
MNCWAASGAANDKLNALRWLTKDRFAFTDTNCADRSVGVENRYIIPDSSFTASSYYDLSRYAPYNGRLYSDYGWGPLTRAKDEYLQIDLGFPYIICAIATQSMKYTHKWVRAYNIRTSLDSSNWVNYQENGRLKVWIITV